MPPASEMSIPADAAAFCTTHWSVVLAAGDSSTDSDQALQHLCQAYWYPLYAYVRRQGHNTHDAQDLTQEFFARLLERKSYRLADRSRGRFRTFLLSSLKHFLINEWSKANRQKRGGGRQVISLDATETESRFRAEPADHRSPDRSFERQWASVLLDRVLDQLRDRLVADGQGSLFAELKFSLLGEDSNNSYAELARRLGITEGNLKVTVHRMRRQYRELLRAEIGRTVGNPAAVEDEMRDLLAALRD